ncbi:MAG: integrase [Chloroflexi bacterium]|nr:MAG: integrase [Chloroflexota bacterium]
MRDQAVLNLVDQWQAVLAVERAATTCRRYVGVIHQFLDWYAAQEHRPLTLRYLTPITLVGYRNALQQTAKTSTVNIHVSALRAWGDWLNQQGAITGNPAARLKVVGRQEPLAPKALKDSEVNALLRAAADSRHPARDTAIVQMLLQTGMRIGECAALHWEDITFGEKQGQVLIRAGKGNKARIVPLNASARQALATYVAPVLQVEPTLKAVAGAWMRRLRSAPSTSLWQSQKGGALSVSAMERVIAGLVRDGAARQLIPAVTRAHTLRHTFATRYLATHAQDLVGLAALLGHSSLNTTRIYVQPTAEQLADRVERIDLNAYPD